MALISIPQAKEERQDRWYISEFLKWKGYYMKCPIYAGIVNAKADAVTASWSCTGTHAQQMTDVLNGFDGMGKETFKTIMNNAVKIMTIGGDYFAEIEYGEHESLGEIPMNVVTLPPNNIKIIIDNGKIKGYEEVSSGPKGERPAKWEPEEILHFAYNPAGAIVHGIGTTEKIEKHLIDLLQVQDDMARIYHSYVDPLEVYQLSTDNDSEINSFKEKVEATQHVKGKRRLYIPKDLVEMQQFGLPQYSVLDPAAWHNLLIQQMIMAERVPELALGTGSVNSEESAKMQFMGFRQLVRWNQQFIEDQIRSQLFTQIFPTKTPDINFSFAAEPEEERYNRIQSTVQLINSIPINEEVKGKILKSLLEEMGVLERG